MTGYTDYLMLIAPPDNIRYDIDSYKRASARVIGNYEGLTSPAHISINHQHRSKPFVARHAISQMAGKLGLLTPHQIHICNFKYFTHGDAGMTIYACVVMDEPTQRWFKGLQGSMRIIQKPIVPHITVVRNIHPDKFKLLWPKFEQCKYNASFLADKLIVLERETYNPNARWQKFKEFKFGEQLMEY